MKHMNLLTLALSALLGLTSCGGSDDDPVTPVVDGTVLSTLTFAAEGGQQTVSASASQEWRAFASNDESWITVTPSTGNAGSVQLTIKASENLNYEAREGEVTLKAGTSRQYVKVRQEAATKPSIVCPIEGNYRLAWNDEFETDGMLTSRDWTYQTANAGWVNNEKQTYVNGTSPEGKEVASVKDGILSINCFKENGKVYSGRIYAQQSTGWTYGYIEASINLPKGKGTWPAFWMMPVNYTAWPDDGEIDIMEEVGYHPNYVSSSLHAKGHVHTNNTQVTHEMLCSGAEGSFHTYGIEWTADYIQTYVDGQKQLYYQNPGTGKVDWPYNAPFYIILNLAWGGDWGGAQGVDETALPVSMQVDWVRVWQK